MSKDPLALAAITAVPPHETEYDAVYAAVTATERGRWFLTEYAGRNRHVETDLVVAAMARIEAAVRAEPAPMAKGLASNTLASDTTVSEAPEFEAPEPKAPASEAPESEAPESEAPESEAPMRDLPAIGALIERLRKAIVSEATRTSEVAAAAERVLDICFGLRERSADPTLCDGLEAAARQISDACKSRSADEHGADSAATLVHELAGRIAGLIKLSPGGAAAGEIHAEAIERAGVGGAAAAAMLESQEEKRITGAVAFLAAALTSSNGDKAAGVGATGDRMDLFGLMAATDTNVTADNSAYAANKNDALGSAQAPAAGPPVLTAANMEPRWRIEAPDFVFDSVDQTADVENAETAEDLGQVHTLLPEALLQADFDHNAGELFATVDSNSAESVTEPLQVPTPDSAPIVAVPDVPVPHAVAPDAAVPDTLAPDTLAPDAAALDSVAPAAAAPDAVTLDAVTLDAVTLDAMTLDAMAPVEPPPPAEVSPTPLQLASAPVLRPIRAVPRNPFVEIEELGDEERIALFG